MSPRLLRYLGLALVAVVVVVISLNSWRQHRGEVGGDQAQQHIQEAEHHAGAAQAIPDHEQALASAKADADRAWSEVRRLRKLVAAQKPGVPASDGPGQAVGEPAADHRDELLAADAVLIDAQAGQIATLDLALKDEQRRSAEWKAAFEDERRARMAQEAATKAWKDAVTSSRWQGRIEGFAVGVALGYVGGRR